MDDYKNEQEWQTRLNDASWAATRSWDSEVMGPMTPKIFNNMKPLIKAAILNFLNSAPPKRPVKSYTGGEPQYATETPDDLLRQSEREGWRWARECEAEVVRVTDVNQDLAAALVACMSVIDANGLGGVVKKIANAALAKHRGET